MPIYVICDYYIHKTALSSSSEKCKFLRQISKHLLSLKSGNLQHIWHPLGLRHTYTPLTIYLLRKPLPGALGLNCSFLVFKFTFFKSNYSTTALIQLGPSSLRTLPATLAVHSNPCAYSGRIHEPEPTPDTRWDPPNSVFTAPDLQQRLPWLPQLPW